MGGTKGASIHVRGVAESLQRLGHRVELLAARVEQEAAGFASRVSEIPFDRALKLVRQSVARDGEHAELARELHGIMLNEGIARGLEEIHARAPIDALYERYSLWSWGGYRFAREHGIPWILEVNAPLVREQQTYRGITLEPVATGVEDLMLRKADAIVVPSAELRDFVYQRVGHRSSVAVLPNGVDVELVAAAPTLPAELIAPLRGRFVVAFSGSLKPWHGIDRLLRAFDRLLATVPKAHLLVIGDGPLGDEVERTAKLLGTERVTWTGAVPHAQVPAWLAHADVGVAPYPLLQDFYFSPLKIVEYLAVGLPVVASDIGQIPDLVQHGETGLLVAPGNGGSLVAALERLAHDRRLREHMGRRARHRARRIHDWSRVAERIEGLFERCLQKRDRSSSVRCSGAEEELRE